MVIYVKQNIPVEGRNINEIQLKFCSSLPEGLVYNRDGFQDKNYCRKDGLCRS